MTLEVRTDHLLTWAGPGQAEALSTSLAAFRRATQTDLARIHRTQDTHSRMLGGLKADVAILKTDMAEVKDAVREILRRLPPAA